MTAAPIPLTTREQELEGEVERLITNYNALLDAAMDLADEHVAAEERAYEAERQREAWRTYAFQVEAERDELKVLAAEAEGWRSDWNSLSAELRAAQRRLLRAGCPPDPQRRPLPPSSVPQHRRFIEAERPATRPFQVVEDHEP